MPFILSPLALTADIIARQPPAELVSATTGPILSMAWPPASACNNTFSSVSNSS
jgi:hypothetical protein